MDIFVTASVCLLVGSVLGVVFHKYIVSEATAIREHFTEEVSGMESRLRAELADLRSKLPRL